MEDALATRGCLREIGDIEWDGVRTNYEDKFLARGMKINRKVLEKVG